MIRVKCRDILKAVSGTLVFGDPETEILGISTDSRKISRGDLFIPLQGERFDGHDFVISSLEAGASAALTHKSEVLTHKDVPLLDDKVMIKVENTQKALAHIAAWYRSLFDIPVVAVTGSVGKTSTKDMVAEVFSQKFNVLKTQGNFNNEIGLPLTLFNLSPEHNAAIIEMGMSNRGEISRLSKIARPKIAIITNIGISHIENLGSRENILKAKMEVLDGMDEKGILILNADDDMLYNCPDMTGHKRIYFGIEKQADYLAFDIKKHGADGTSFRINLGGTIHEVFVPAPGIHNIYNALAAIGAGLELGILPEEIIKGISEFSPGKMRLNIFEHKGIKIIDDAYNASPQSMEAALSVLKDISGDGRTVAVMGDMLELGKHAGEAHMKSGTFAASKEIDFIVAVGKMGSDIVRGAESKGYKAGKARAFKTNEEAGLFLESFLKSGDTVLVKGSRGMKMEQIVEALKKL